MATVKMATEQKRDLRMSVNDPVLKTINSIAETLEPLDREAQLRALASACIQLDMLDYAEVFLNALRDEKGR